ncbi:hypothetical protein BGX34_001060, partial [Mortierella sp. NVP85]
MDFEAVSQFAMGNHSAWGFIKETEAGSRILQFHQDKPLVLPFLALLPFLFIALFRFYTVSPVVLTYNDNPVMLKLFDRKTGKTATEDYIEYLARKVPSLMDRHAAFRPSLWMTSGHLQTAYAAYKGFENKYIIPYQR